MISIYKVVVNVVLGGDGVGNEGRGGGSEIGVNAAAVVVISVVLMLYYELEK